MFYQKKIRTDIFNKPAFANRKPCLLFTKNKKKLSANT